MNLPKSKRARFCQCPKMLRQGTGTYHPELAVQDEALLRILQIPKQYSDSDRPLKRQEILDFAGILSPASLRERIAADLEAARGKYN